MFQLPCGEDREGAEGKGEVMNDSIDERVECLGCGFWSNHNNAGCPLCGSLGWEYSDDKGVIKCQK